jgi:histidine phosphotransferase ChpT
MDETSPAELAARLADRLCHDILSSSQALASGLDLLAEAANDGEREEARSLLVEATAAQRAKVTYARRAFGQGPSASATGELRDLSEALYADLRASLVWAVEAFSLGPVGSRTLLNLVQIAADTLAAGGEAHVSCLRDGAEIEVAARGPRASLKEEARAGLAGQAFGAGLSGRWVQGAFVSALVNSAGGVLRVDAREGEVVFAVNLPPGA